MYEGNDYSIRMEGDLGDDWLGNDSEQVSQEDDLFAADVDPDSSSQSGQEDPEEEAKGPLDVFRQADEETRLGVIKKIFPTVQQKEFVDIYKEEEASQAELTDDDDWDIEPVSGDDYFLLKYIENHPEILEEKEEDVADALEID